MGKTERCPRCGYVIWQTDEACLPSAPGSVKSDKPNPHVVTEELQADGDIMKAGKDWWGCRNSEDSLCAFEDFTRLIEAKIEDVRQGRKLYTPELEPRISQLEAKIEAMRKLFRNHEGRIAKIEHYSPNLHHNSNVQGDKIKTLERKVEELEKRVKASIVFDLIRKEPQPKGGVALPSSGWARCKDKEGVEHDLISGVSFYKTVGFELVRFKYSDGHALFGEALLGFENRVVAPGESEARTSNVTFLFDLPACGDEGTSPPFAKVQDVGGGK